MSGGPSYDDAANSIRRRQSIPADEDFDYLVHHAVLAANSHNTQPWLFRKSATGLTIEPDWSRSTPVVDPDFHHLFASLGCAAENLMLAANAAGRGAALSFDGHDGGRISIDLAGQAARDPLFDAIPDRQCTRSDYDGKPVSSEDLDGLVKTAAIEGCELLIIPEKNRIEQALELIVAANTVQVEDPAFAAELKSWLRFSAAKAIATGDGLYAACSGNPTMPQWLGNMVFGFVFTSASENDRYARQIRSSSGLAVFVTEKDDKEHWVKAGRSYQRFALKATALGLRHAFLNQPVEVAAMRPEFSKWLGITGGRADLILRYGHAPPMPKSLRRPAKDVMIAPAPAAT